jgi:hypothetical protein
VIGTGATEKTSRAVSKNALSAGDCHRSSCQTIWVRTSKGSCHRSAASLPSAIIEPLFEEKRRPDGRGHPWRDAAPTR